MFKIANYNASVEYNPTTPEVTIPEGYVTPARLKNPKSAMEGLRRETVKMLEGRRFNNGIGSECGIAIREKLAHDGRKSQPDATKRKKVGKKALKAMGLTEKKANDLLKLFFTENHECKWFTIKPDPKKPGGAVMNCANGFALDPDLTIRQQVWAYAELIGVLHIQWGVDFEQVSGRAIIRGTENVFQFLWERISYAHGGTESNPVDVLRFCAGRLNPMETPDPVNLTKRRNTFKKYGYTLE